MAQGKTLLELEKNALSRPMLDRGRDTLQDRESQNATAAARKPDDHRPTSVLDRRLSVSFSDEQTPEAAAVQRRVLPAVRKWKATVLETKRRVRDWNFLFWYLLPGYYLVGIAAYVFTDASAWDDKYFPSMTEKPPLVDCIIQGAYYATQVLTTIGYGDVIPIADYLRLLNAVYIIVGLILVSTSVFTRVVQDQVERRIDRVTVARKSMQLARMKMNAAGRAELQKELDDHAEAERVRKLMKAFVLCVAPLLVGGAIYGYVLEWNLYEAVNWAVVTSSTTGFGGLYIDHRWLRAFSIVWMNIAVVSFALGTATLSSVLTAHWSQHDVDRSLQELKGDDSTAGDGTSKSDDPLDDEGMQHLFFDADALAQVTSVRGLADLLLNCERITSGEYEGICTALEGSKNFLPTEDKKNANNDISLYDDQDRFNEWRK
ncbi:unnamed protein product [Amoebophrya sp. A120]|nr:unnamed protein product [Amoebophrya sp. A120]|eukprot:GSA120T00018071001.1